MSRWRLRGWRRLVPSILTGLLIVSLCKSGLIDARSYLRQPPITEVPTNASTVRFFSEGDGRAALISDREGHHVLLGIVAPKHVLLLVHELLVRHVRKLDCVVLPCPTSAEMNSVTALAAHIWIGRVVTPAPSPSPGPSLRPPKWSLTVVQPGNTFEACRDVRMLLLPFASEGHHSTSAAGSAGASLAVEQVRFLFADSPNYWKGLNLQQPLQCDVLRTPAGSAEAAGLDDLLRISHPKVAIVTGHVTASHDREELMERLLDSWIDVYPLDRVGTVTVVCRDGRYRILRS